MCPAMSEVVEASSMSGWRHTAELSVGAGQITAAEVKARAAPVARSAGLTPITATTALLPFRCCNGLGCRRRSQVDLQRSQQDAFLMARMLQAFDLFQQVNPAMHCAAARG
jgi:hypothetical protein